MKKILFFLLAIIFAIQGYSQSTFTVANGTATNSYLPVYGFWMDANQHNQFIYPASLLGPLPNGTISKLTFHATAATCSWGSATCIIKIGVPTESNFASATYSTTTLTQVYSGPIAVANSILEFILPTPYVFSGGNLLIDITTVSGSFSSLNFYGITATNGAVYQYSSNPITLQQFLPKMSVEFTGGTPMVVTNPATSVLATSAVFTGNFYAFTPVTAGFQYMDASLTDWTSATVVNETTLTSPLSETVTTLNPNSQYKYRAFANDGTTNYFGEEKTFTTLSLPATLPYACDFENPTENAEWAFINGTQTNQWVIGNASYNPAVNNTVSGENALHISNDAGLSWAYTLATSSTPSRVYAYRDFTIDPGVTEIKLNLDWIANGNGYGDFLRVYWVPASTIITPGVVPPGGLDVSAALGTFFNNTNNNIHLQQVSTWQQNEFIINSTQFPTLGGNTWRLLIHWRNESTSAAVQPPATVDNMTLVVSNCPTPIIDSINNIAQNSVDIHFTENGSTNAWNFQYRILGTNTWSLAQATMNPFTLSGLQPSTSYEVRMQSDCSFEQSAWTPIKKFNTACGTITQIPWADYFDNYGTGTTIFPACWTRKANVADRPYISSTNFSSPGSMYFNCASSGIYNNASTPMIDAAYPINTLMLNFRSYFSGSDDTLYVGTMTDPIDSTTFTEIAKFSSTATATWINQVLYLNSYTGTDQYITFRTKYGASSSTIYIDNLQILPMPTCLIPHSYFVNNILSTEGTVNWTPSDISNNEFYLYYKLISSTVWDSVQVFGTTQTLTSLLPNTVYQYYLRTVCGSEFSEATNIATFRTACAPFDQLPYSENFDTYGTGSYTNYPVCWTRLSNYGNYPYISSTNYSSPGSLYLYAYNNTYTLASINDCAPTININDLKVNFKMYGSSTAYNVKVGVMTNPALRSTFVQVGATQYVNAANVWEPKEVSLSSYTGTGRYITFLVEEVTGGTNTMYIDDVVVDALPACPNVYSFNVDAVSTTEFSANWDASTDDGTGFILSYAVNPTTLPFDPTTGTQVNVPTGTALPLVIGSLTPGDTIYTAVQAACGSNWTAVKKVILPTIVSTVPYSCAFEDTTQNATWIIQNGSQTNKWYIGTPGGNGGSGNGLYISSDNGVTATYSTSATTVVMASTIIQFSDAPEFDLSFDWANYGESGYDYIIAYVVPLSYNIVPGTMISDIYRVTPNLNSSSTWQTRNVVLGSQYSSTVKRLVFQWRNDSFGGSNPPGLVDNVTITPLFCESPSNLIVSNVDTTFAVLTWDNSPAGVEFLIEYKQPTDTVWTVISTFDTTFTLTLLTPATTYNARIKAVCTPGDTSFSSNTVSFTTLCVPLFPPTVNEPFNTMVPTICWERKAGLLPTTGNAALSNSTGGWYIRTSFGQNTAAVNQYSSSCNYWLISPSIDLGDGSVLHQLNFELAITDYYNSSAGNTAQSPNARFVVLISTDNGGTWNSTGILKDWNNSTGIPFSTLTNTLQNQSIVLFDSVALAPYSGIVRFAFFVYENDASGNYDNDLHIDNFQVVPYSACQRPTGLQTTNVTQTEVTLSWIELGQSTAWNIEYGPQGFTQGTGTIVPTTNNPHTISGLTTGTTYQFYVQADCGAGETSVWSNPTSATPGQILMTLASDTVYACAGTVFDNGGINGDYSNSFNGTLVIYPETPGNIVQISGTYTGETCCDYLYIYDGDNITSPLLGTYMGANLTIPTFTSSVGPITLRFTSDGSGVGAGFALNVNCIPAATCPRPTNLAASAPTPTSVTLNWTENGTASEWQVEYGAPGFAQGTGAYVTATSNPFTVPSLTSATTYDFYVRAICGAGDTSIWSMKTVGATTCLPTTLPFTENFTGATFPICWSQTYSGAVTSNRWSINLDAEAGGTPNEMKCSYQNVIGSTRLITPGIDFGTNTSATLTFKHFYSDFDPGVTLKIQSSTDLVTWTDQPYTIISGNGDVGPETVTVPLTLTSGLNYISWNVDGNLFNINYWYIDDVSITVSTPICAVPTNLAVAGITSSTATATWTAGGSEAQWEIAYKPTAGSTWNTAFTSAPTYPLPSLTAATPYDVKVRAICGAGDTSAYTAIVNFTTLVTSCPAPTALAATAITTTGATITWTPGGSETAWELDYKMASASTWTTVNTTAPSHIFTTLTPSTDYNVRVRAICGTGNNSDYTAVVNFTTATPPCLIPTNVVVPTATITDQSAVVNWTAAAGQTQWQVEYKLVSSANWTTMQISTATTQTITPLQSNSTYEVRVKAICSATNESPFTTPVQFTTTGAVTYIITATASGPGTINPTGSVVVNAGANQTFTFTPTGNAHVVSLLVDNLSATYSNNEYTFSNVLANHTISVNFAEAIDENGLAKLVELFPNPTNATIEIRLNETQLQVKECRVYDIYGKLMSIVPVNADNTKIDVTDFAAGVYFIRMNSEMGVITKKFVKK